MINYNSPIMAAFNQQQQNMMQPNMTMQTPYIPQPIGNMVNMGTGYNQPNPLPNMGMGYNQQPNPLPNMGMGMGMNQPANPLQNGMMGGGYYNGQSGYYNPYLIQQQQRQLEAQKRQIELQNANIFKDMSRRVNNAMGTHQEDIEQHVTKYDPQFIQQERMTEEQREELKTLRLYQIDAMNIQQTPQEMAYLNGISKERERMSKLIPDDMGLADFFDVMSDEALRLKEMEARMQQRQLNKLYNTDQYNKLINMHQNSSKYFNSVYGNQPRTAPTTIDDMEITLPSSIQDKIQQRKMAFLNAIPRG